MSKNVTIGMIPYFWEIRRPGRPWNEFEMGKISKLLLDDGFGIASTEVRSFVSGASRLIVVHSDEGAITMFVLKYNDVLQKHGLTLKPYEHNTKKDKVKDGNVRTL